MRLSAVRGPPSKGPNQVQANHEVTGSAPAGTQAGSGAVTAGTPPKVRTALRRPTVEQLAVITLGLLVAGVHNVPYLLRQPYWTDEAWVAVTTRFPLSELSATTSSTPIGWSVLLRLFTVRGEQTGRLLPLAFAAAAVMIAYWLGRGIGWQRRDISVGAGLLAAVAVLLVPAMLVRDDLKQYTADACLSLLVLALTSRLERNWSRRTLAGLSVAVWGGMLFSDAVAFVGVVAFGALFAATLCRRDWRRLAETALTGAATAALMAAVYEAFDARADYPGLKAYWSGFYLPAAKGLHADVEFVISRWDSVGAYFGLGPVWVAAPLVVAGLVTMFRAGRPVTAIAVAALWPELLVLSALGQYPFLDLRTSTFLFAITAAVAAIGVAGVCSLLIAHFNGLLAAGLAAVALVVFAAGTAPYVRSRQIPVEDVRDQVRYIVARESRDEVILVNLNSNWGFAYYWPAGNPARRPDSAVAQGYEAYFPNKPDIVIARNRDVAAIDAALSQALALARQHSCSRIWLVRTHLSAREQVDWRVALRQQKLALASVGRHGLGVIREAPRAAGEPGCRQAGYDHAVRS
jgi:hypothetical protein